MAKFELGESITVETPTINDGDSFEASVVSVDSDTETVAVEPDDLETVKLAIVGFSEVRKL